jgi:hypothetical protein
MLYMDTPAFGKEQRVQRYFGACWRIWLEKSLPHQLGDIVLVIKKTTPWGTSEIPRMLYIVCFPHVPGSKGRRWKLSFASKHSMSRSGKVDAEGAGPGESLAEFVLHQWVDPKMRGILWYTVPQKLAYCSPMVKMFETRIIPWYWGYSNFLQVLYDIICCFS